MPRELDDDWTAEKVVAKFAPKNGAVAVEKIQLALTQNKAVLELDVAMLGTTIDKPAIVKKISALEK